MTWDADLAEQLGDTPADHRCRRCGRPYDTTAWQACGCEEEGE